MPLYLNSINGDLWGPQLFVILLSTMTVILTRMRISWLREDAEKHVLVSSNSETGHVTFR